MSKSKDEVAELIGKAEKGKEISDADAVYLRDRGLLPDGVELDDDPTDQTPEPQNTGGKQESEEDDKKAAKKAAAKGDDS